MKTVIFLFLFSVCFACTDFVVQAKDGAWVGGRSLEFGLDLQAGIKVFPRKQTVRSQSPDKMGGVQWTSKYGYLGVTGLGMDFSFEGMNEMGLSFGYLWLPGFTQYPTVAQSEMKKALDFTDFGAWVLGQFSSVAEVKNALNNVIIWGHTVDPLGVPPVHAAIHDAQGNSIVVEFTDGKMKVYDNPISVLTNSPTFDWHINNLPNYLNFDAENAEPYTFRGKTVAFQGQGSGFIGLPGDWTPASRFIRIASMLRFTSMAASATEAVNVCEHLLNTVDVPMGVVREKNTMDFTQWVVIKDMKNKVFYFRSYKDLCLKMIDMKKLDFDKGSNKSVNINTSKGYIDITSSLSN